MDPKNFARKLEIVKLLVDSIYWIVSLGSKGGKEKRDGIKLVCSFNISDRPTKLVRFTDVDTRHVRENYPLNWMKKERVVRNKKGIRKEESCRTLNGILYAKHVWQFLPSLKRVFFLRYLLLLSNDISVRKWIALFLLLFFVRCFRLICKGENKYLSKFSSPPIRVQCLRSQNGS